MSREDSNIDDLTEDDINQIMKHTIGLNIGKMLLP